MLRSRFPAVLVAGGLVLAGCSGDQPPTSGSARPDTAGALAAAQPAGGATTTRDGITVVGEGRISGRPDVVRATVGVEVTADSVQAALERANEQAAAVIAALRDAGIPEDDIQTREVSLHERHRERPPQPQGQQPAGGSSYVATNLVEVRIGDVDGAGEVLQAAADAGGEAARIRSVRFALEENDELLSAARERAFADARAKAAQYAQLAGRELGELVAVDEVHSSRPGPTPFAGGDEATARAGSLPVAPGSEEQSVQVVMVWSLA